MQIPREKYIGNIIGLDLEYIAQVIRYEYFYNAHFLWKKKKYSGHSAKS